MCFRPYKDSLVLGKIYKLLLARKIFFPKPIFSQNLLVLGNSQNPLFPKIVLGKIYIRVIMTYTFFPKLKRLRAYARARRKTLCEITKTEFFALLKDLIIKTLIYLLATCWQFAEKRSKNALKPFLRRFYQSSSFTLKRNKNGRKVEKRSSVGLSRRCRGAQEDSHHNKEEHSKEHHATTPGKESFF